MNLSIIIPAFGPQTDIDSTVLSVLENRPHHCEILLVHGNSYVDPYQLDDELQLIESDAASLLELVNEGFRQARAPVVHTLTPGVVVTEEWYAPALQRFEQDSRLGSVSPAIFVGKSKRPVLGVRYHASSGRSLVRHSRQVLAPSINSGFYLRSAVQFMKGFHEPYGGLADVDLGLRLRSANYRTATEKSSQLEVQKINQPRALTGFSAGQTRGRLGQLASQLGLQSRVQSLLGTLTEPMRNGFGLGMFSGLVGRCLVHLSKPQPNVHSIDAGAKRKHRSAA